MNMGEVFRRRMEFITKIKEEKEKGERRKCIGRPSKIKVIIL